MQIAITKKLAEAMAIKPDNLTEAADPLFSWTANWTNTFSNRKEDMVVMINNATRFPVVIYGVKRNQFKDIAEKMTNAIRNTLLALNVNNELIDYYMLKSGEISFYANHDRKQTACVNSQCLNASLRVGNRVNRSSGKIKFSDTFGTILSDSMVNCSDVAFIPREKFLQCLAELTGKPIYQYRAFELVVTLDLDVYKAVRRLIVPADLEFLQLHKVLQDVYGWRDYHLFDFCIFDGKSNEPVARLVSSEEELEFTDDTALMSGHKLSDYLPENKFILYTYDMGDNWEHEIELVREIENYDKESPYLLEAVGQAPPEDVGGVGGFVEFREIMLDPSHPEYAETNEWIRYWNPELSGWDSRPHAIRL